MRTPEQMRFTCQEVLAFSLSAASKLLAKDILSLLDQLAAEKAEVERLNKLLERVFNEHVVIPGDTYEEFLRAIGGGDVERGWRRARGNSNG